MNSQLRKQVEAKFPSYGRVSIAGFVFLRFLTVKKKKTIKNKQSNINERK